MAGGPAAVTAAPDKKKAEPRCFVLLLRSKAAEYSRGGAFGLDHPLSNIAPVVAVPFSRSLGPSELPWPFAAVLARALSWEER